MPKVIHACKTTIDHGDDCLVEHRDWWPVEIGGAVTSYTRTDLVDELIEGMLNAIEGADHNDDDSGSGANGSAYEAAATFKNDWLQGEAP